MRQPPRRHSRLRLGAARLAELVTSTLGGRAFYRATYLSPPRLREETARVRDLAPELEGFSVVQLTDFHAGSFLGPGDLAQVVELSNALEPDVVALTGDFVTHGAHEIARIAADLGRLRAREGVFAVFGNHDYRGRQEARIEAALPAVRFLRNAGVRLARGSAVVALTGLEDLEEGRVVDLDAARGALEPGDVEIVLCHNPLGARAIARPGCAAVLAGHTHGGQVDLPLLRRLGPKHPGARVVLGSTLLVVAGGLGAIGLPLRVGAPAEIVRLRLARQA
ncbi:MAG: metallophosphoesterase [Planctomycetes bacterium]|nr:metallophosphoesterase [Planctomycetota bacterium]